MHHLLLQIEIENTTNNTIKNISPDKCYVSNNLRNQEINSVIYILKPLNILNCKFQNKFV